MSSDVPKYSCGNCHRTYTWKKEVAGKRGKCKCGQMVTVPLHPPQAEPVEDDLYALAELSSDAKSAVIDRAPIVIPTAAVALAAPEALEYQRPAITARTPRSDRVDPLTGELYDPFRDYIAPAILLAAGFAGIAVYIIQKMGTGPLVGFAISIAFAIMLAVTLFKTAVLTLAAVPLAAYCDVNVGLLRTAIFKFAGTILFGDIAILWLIAAMQSAGMISKKYDGGPAVWLVYLVVLAVVYHICFWYLFRLSGADIKFAGLMSLVSRLCNFFMTLIVIALIMSLAASHARPTASPYVSAIRAPPMITPGTPLTVQPGQTGPTALDELISQRIRQNPFRIQEGYAWCRTGAADDADKKLVSDMYGAGADKVYVDGFTLYALLPDNPAKRSACLNVAHVFRKDNGIPDTAATNNLNYQYVVIGLLGERLKRLHHGN
ncbi:MAG: hypothetical protein ABSB74_21295 [Tepidisphaeraceae bacterium]